MKESGFPKAVFNNSESEKRERRALKDGGEMYEAGRAIIPKPWSEKREDFYTVQ